MDRKRHPHMKTALVPELRNSKKYLPVAELQAHEESSQLIGQQIAVLISYAGQLYEVGQGTVEEVAINNDIEFGGVGPYGQQLYKPSSRSRISITIRR
jgi:hypothetical protein